MQSLFLTEHVWVNHTSISPYHMRLLQSVQTLSAYFWVRCTKWTCLTFQRLAIESKNLSKTSLPFQLNLARRGLPNRTSSTLERCDSLNGKYKPCSNNELKSHQYTALLLTFASFSKELWHLFLKRGHLVFALINQFPWTGVEWLHGLVWACVQQDENRK